MTTAMRSLTIPAVPNLKAEQRRLKALARGGDRAARARLVETLVPLAVEIAGRGMRPGDADDRIGEAFLALLHAVDDWDPARGAASNCATTYIRNHLRSVSRTTWKGGGRASVTAGRWDDDSAMLDAVPDRRDGHVGAIADRDAVACLLRTLDPLRREILGLRYGLDPRGPLTAREVAALLGISRQRVHLLTTRTLARLAARDAGWAP